MILLATPPFWASSSHALFRANIKPPVELVVADLATSWQKTNIEFYHEVAYKPSPSREGAGQMVYTTKTDPKGAKAGASFATSCIPYVGDAKDIQEAVTGKDLITGKKLTGGERAITITAAVLPVVSSPMLKGAAKGGKVAVKEAPNAVKKAGGNRLMPIFPIKKRKRVPLGKCVLFSSSIFRRGTLFP